jgi:hypothetical protein
MTDEALAEAVAAFLDQADVALADYERGYTDADATVRRLRADLETLREAADDGER